MIKVLIAEDELEAAKALKQNIDDQEGIKVIAIASNGQEAVEFCRFHFPDIVLMDIRMPIMNGIEASSIIKKEMPNIKILFLTLFAEQKYIQEAFNQNANGFILKGRSSGMIISCIRQVMSGFHVADQIVMRSDEQKNSRSEPCIVDLEKFKLLSNTEKKVIEHIITGRTNAEIAKSLRFSEGYVRNVISRVLRKTELPNSKALAAWAFRMGLKQ